MSTTHLLSSAESASECQGKAWQSICASHAIRCVADRSWKFFTPLYLSKSCGSLKPTAAMALAENLAVASLSTAAANVYEPEHTVAVTLLENASVILGGILMFLFVARNSVGSNKLNHLGQAPLKSPLFLLAMICSCIDSVCSTLLSNTISKEWVATLFHSSGSSSSSSSASSSESLLASANARMSQIDLVVATTCPLLVSRMIQMGNGKNNYKRTLIVLLAQHAIATTVVVFNMKRAMKWQPSLSHYNKSQEEETTKSNSNSNSNSNAPSIRKSMNPLAIFADDAIPARTKMVTVAYILLYCTVLSPSSILHSWLNSIFHNGVRIVKESSIAWFGSSAQLFGTMATIMTPSLIQRFGKYGAGLGLQYFQSACIVMALYSFYQTTAAAKATTVGGGGNGASAWLIWGFLLPVSLSRVGLWGFDLAERQVLQETIPREKQTVFFNSERSLTQLASLFMNLLCYVVSDPKSFGTLVNLSAGAVVTASTILGLSHVLFHGSGSSS